MNNLLKKKLTKEFSQLKSLSNLESKIDWDLIWVLSADQLDINRSYKNRRNETRERFETGINLAKQVGSLRTGHGQSQITLENIINHTPKIYFSGYNNHNKLMTKYVNELYFEHQYNFPGTNIIIGPTEDNIHTDSQFQKFPEELISKNRIIVIITDAYHIPRCRRYLIKYLKKFPKEKFIFYPSKPIVLTEKSIKLEINKILKYTENKILPNLS